MTFILIVEIIGTIAFVMSGAMLAIIKNIIITELYFPLL